MKRLVWILLLALVAPEHGWSQDLNGTYAFQSAQGTLTLVLQHEQNRVTGTLTGADGSVNRLDGMFDGVMATGTIEVTGGSGWFAAGFLDGGLTLLVAELDPRTGQPDLENGWRLDFARSATAAQPAPAPAASGGQPGGPALPPPAAAANSPLVQEWMQHLRGNKVTYLESYGSGGGGFSNRWEAFLCSDMRFFFRSSSSVSADVGGVSGFSGGSDSFAGTWRIIEQGGQPILQYQRSELAGTDQGEWVALSYRNGSTYFDSNRVFVTNDNTVCG
jgi:hypothetical protein